MKIILIGINSKFIHPNLAIRYLKANSDCQTEIIEYTIKDSEDEIYNDIIQLDPDVIGFSCYIWNIKVIKHLAKKLKIYNKNYIILFGGPEVSFEYENYLENKIADYIIINEGEIAFNKFVKALKKEIPIETVDNLVYMKEEKIIRNRQNNIEDLNLLRSPYKFEEDYQDIKNKVQYVELSRGCPYKCSYCLASLEKGLRFFSLKETLERIDFLVSKGAKTIKFLDRSFNANKKVALQFFKELVNKDYPNTVFQFEINGDVLNLEIVDYLIKNLKKNYFRFELGIQSTNPDVNIAIDRIQDTERLVANIKEMQKSNLVLHLDLIAGLPYEDLNSFKKTFNEIFLLFPEELQLGFLKMLKGTKMRREADYYNYIYSEDPPYEIIENRFITRDELSIIHEVEKQLEIYWNKGFMKETIKIIINSYGDPFNFFLELSNYYNGNQLLTSKYQLYDIFTNLIGFLDKNGKINKEIIDQLKLDYLKHHKIKPKIFWSNNFNKNEIIRDFFKKNQDYPLDTLYKYSLICEYRLGYLITLYLPKKREFYYFYSEYIEKIS